jgi:hypothetical protein
MIDFNKESTWSEISTRFCRFHGLPYGSALKIIYTSNPKYPKGRVQRNNTVYRRASFRKKTLAQARDDENVGSLIANHLLPYIDMDLKAMGADVGAYGPDGERLDVRTSIRKWRGFPPLPTEDEIEAENAREREIDEISDEARIALGSISEFRWDPEDTVPRGTIRALIRIYGAAAVREALAAET